nr:hypothetical protein CFP56_37005 [Quercus suber]
MFRGTYGGDARNRPNKDPMEDNFSMDQEKEGQSDFSESSLVVSDELVVGTCLPADYGGSTVVGTCVAADKNVQSSGFSTGIGGGCALTQPDVVSRGGTEQGDAEMVQMDFEGGGQVDASF